MIYLIKGAATRRALLALDALHILGPMPHPLMQGKERHPDTARWIEQATDIGRDLLRSLWRDAKKGDAESMRWVTRIIDPLVPTDDSVATVVDGIDHVWTLDLRQLELYLRPLADPKTDDERQRWVDSIFAGGPREIPKQPE